MNNELFSFKIITLFDSLITLIDDNGRWDDQYTKIKDEWIWNKYSKQKTIYKVTFNVVIYSTISSALKNCCKFE